MSQSAPYDEFYLSKAQRNHVLDNPWLFPQTERLEWLSMRFPRRLGVLPHVGLLTITSTTGGQITAAPAGKVAVINRISVVYPEGVSALDFDIYKGTGAAGGAAAMIMPVVDDIIDIGLAFDHVEQVGTTIDGSATGAIWNAGKGTPAVDTMIKADRWLRKPVVLRASAGLQNKIQLGTFTSATSATTTIGTYTVGDSEDVSFAAVGWEVAEKSFDSWVNQQNWFTRLFRPRGDELYANETSGVFTTTNDNIVDPGASSVYFIDGFNTIANDALTPINTSITYGTSPTDFTGYDIDNQQELVAIADPGSVKTYKDGGDTYWTTRHSWAPVMVNGDGGIYSDLHATNTENVIGLVEDGAVTAGAGRIRFTGWDVDAEDLLEDE
jgi:hypothetical protein